jgi:hypothetical protein
MPQNRVRTQLADIREIVFPVAIYSEEQTHNRIRTEDYVAESTSKILLTK